MNDARSAKDDVLALSSSEALAKVGSRDIAALGIGTLRELRDQGNQHIHSLAAKTLTELDVTD
jgi:hypothetical protein